MSNIHGSLSQPPGTIVFVGEQKHQDTKIDVIAYNKTRMEEKVVENIDTYTLKLEEDTITWINVVGLHDVDLIERLANSVNVDSILIEDIVNTSRRPKVEDIEDYFFFIIKDLSFNKVELKIEVEHLAFVVGKNYILTFQETELDNFNTIRDRLRKALGGIRKAGVDYLFNRLLDSIVDNYFLVIHELGELIESLEDKVIYDPSKQTLSEIQNLKQEVILLRRICLPVREVVGIMLKLESVVISDKTQVFVRSIFDHLNQIIDSVEIYREMLSGFLDIYLSSLSNKTNDVMKVLTIVTSVFIPLSFLAGVYGMNFKHMPELETAWGYPLIWLVMLSVAGTMLLYFRRLGWLQLE